MTVNRQFALVRRPVGEPSRDDFELRERDVPRAGEGEVVIRNRYASLDPAQRGWMDDVPSYVPPMDLDAPVRAGTLGVIHESRHPDFKVGDWVTAMTGLEDYSKLSKVGGLKKVDVEAADTPTRFLSAIGPVGFTAYFGLLHDAKPKSGDTVLISAAAGAVGSLVGQIAKIKGCRTIGIAGGAEKCAKLISEYRYDHAIDYRGKSMEQLSEEIRKVAPDGVNIVFENVGGDILDAALMNLTLNAHIVICGLISEYNKEQPVGARNLWQLIVNRATMKGIFVRDYAPHFKQAGVEMAQWMSEGRISFEEDIQHGLENAYDAFMRLFRSQNTGKLILQIA